jgi:peptide/nickel transport system ATP-binding protein
MILCQLKNVKKYFLTGLTSDNKTKAVDGVDLSLTEGEVFSVVGESGSGKTTLGRILADLYRPDSGEVLFLSRNIRQLKKTEYREFRRSVQLVFQDPFSSLDPRFSVRRILLEAFTLQEKTEKSEQQQRMIEILSAVGLPQDILNRYPHEFSGGERQRISIARAVLCRPKLVILDEAVSSLDVLVQEHILKLLECLKSQFGLTYLFISHNLRVVRKISDKIAVMYKGRIVEYGPARELMTNPRHPYTLELLTAAVEFSVPDQSREWSLPESQQGALVGPDHWVLNTVQSKERL